jgi:exosome complex RNA-binding protein Rrp4
MESEAAIRIERRASIQDLVRRYTVFIDEQVVGRISAFQKRSFPVDIGQHRVQLKIVNTGTSASTAFDVDVRAGETRILRTHRHTSKEYLEAPLGIVAPDRFAPRPWIGLELLDR